MITRFIRNEHIIMNLKSKTKEKLFKEILDKTDFSDEKKNLIFCSLKQREVLGTTGIGKGIAIPHSRSLILEELKLFIGISKKGIEYEAMDGKPVHIVFLIIAPPLDEANQYLILLGKIAALSKELTKNKNYLKVGSTGEFIEMIKSIEENMEDIL